MFEDDQARSAQFGHFGDNALGGGVAILVDDDVIAFPGCQLAGECPVVRCVPSALTGSQKRIIRHKMKRGFLQQGGRPVLPDVR